MTCECQDGGVDDDYVGSVTALAGRWHLRVRSKTFEAMGETQQRQTDCVPSRSALALDMLLDSYGDKPRATS